jgi:3-phenylpropionate/cinnamic acid dioxygenase small subunit
VTVSMLDAEALVAHLVTQALAREAHLLDTHRYAEWLELLDSEVRYVVPIPEWVRDAPGEPAPVPDGEELAFTYLDETYESLRLRVARLQTGLAHGEMPPSMTARVIGMPLISPGEQSGDDEMLCSVVSTFTLHQTRHENRIDVFAGRRDDRWSVAVAPTPQVRLRFRKVHLIQRTLPRAFSSFF